MYKKIFLVLASAFFSFSSVSAISLIDINDETKDKTLKPQYLSQYIKTVFNSRAAHLKQKIEELKEQKNGFTSLGLDKSGWTVVTDNLSQIPEDSESAQAQKLSLIAYENQLAFFEKPLILYNNPQSSFEVNLLNSSDFFYYYLHTAKMIEKQYGRLCNILDKLKGESSIFSALLEPVLFNNEQAIEDLVGIIRVLRPHLPIPTPSVEKIFENLALIDCWRQWKRVLSNPALQKAIEEASLAEKKSALPSSKGKEAIPDEPSVIDLKDKVNNNNASLLSAGKQNLTILSPTKIPSLLAEKKENKANFISPSAPNMPLTSKTKNKDTKKKKTKKHLVPPKKEKTRPGEGEKYLQSLNGLFEEEPALNIAQKKLMQGEPQAINSPSLPSNALPSLHGQQYKVLEKLMDSHTKASSLDVDEVLNFLRYLGFIKECSSGHKKLMTKTIEEELWLNGERTLIEILPLEILAVSHKSNRTREFKPYVVMNIRKALEKAGFDKLLNR